jgi:hypothetical protein
MLTQAEIDQLVRSGRYMTFIMGVRFLTDYLQGDVYYKTKHPKHNLQRVRAQFQLIKCMESAEVDMGKVVERFI